MERDGKKDISKKNLFESRLGFEILLSDISAHFINIPWQDIDQNIKQGLRSIVEFLGFDRGSLFQLSETGMTLTHSSAAKGFESMNPYIAEKEIPWALNRILKDKSIVKFGNINELPDKAAKDKIFFEKYGPVSVVAFPLIADGDVFGAVAFGNLKIEKSLPDDLVERVRLVGIIFANALIRKNNEKSLQQAFSEISLLKDQLKMECGYLREEIDLEFKHGEIVGQSDAIKKVLMLIEQVASTDSTVLLSGETGTGKELLARAIHNLSKRKKRVMVKVNCTTLPSTLVESELFGREKGAYTGAMIKQTGRFEVADGSTIFLDEISEMPFELQPKLLRVIQEGEFERLGSTKTIQVNTRIISATNRDLAKYVKTGNFREDLYFRLNVFPIIVPPLRERIEDIPLLIWTFVREFEEIMGKTIEKIPQKSMEAMTRYHWPGNVRELKNMVERAMILNQGPSLALLAPANSSSKNEILNLHELEKNHIIKILRKTSGLIRGNNGAAELLGLKPTTLDAKIKRLKIPRHPYQAPK
jgi:transcriptional regulator with GAF, ATPase, and Fis domain